MKQFLINSRLITYILLAIPLFSLIKSKFDIIRYKENITSLNSEIRTYKTKSGKDAATIKNLTVTSKEIEDNLFVANKNLDDLKKEFKKVKSTLTILQNTKIDTVKVPFKVNIPCNFKITDSLKTPHYSFSYFINQQGFSLIDLEIPNEINIVTGLKVERKNWFKKIVTPSTDVSNTNPYIKTNNVISQQPVEIKDNSYKWAAPLGFVIGLLVAK